MYLENLKVGEFENLKMKLKDNEQGNSKNYKLPNHKI